MREKNKNPHINTCARIIQHLIHIHNAMCFFSVSISYAYNYSFTTDQCDDMKTSTQNPYNSHTHTHTHTITNIRQTRSFPMTYDSRIIPIQRAHNGGTSAYIRI